MFKLRKRYQYLNALAVGIIIVWVGNTSLAVSESPKKRFGVRESVEMSYFGTIDSSVPYLLPDDGVVSPDGRYVIKLTHRGLVVTGMTEATLWLFDVPAVVSSIRDSKIQPPKPVRLLTLSAAANGLNGNYMDTGSVIFQPTWTKDSKKIIFLGRDKSENRRLFDVDIRTKVVRPITPPDQDVVTYSMVGSSLAYLAAEDSKSEQTWWSSGPGIADSVTGTTKSLIPLLYPNFVGEAFSQPVDLEVWRILNGKPVHVIDQATGSAVNITSRYTSLVAAISPNGLQFLTIAHATPVSRDKPNTPEPSLQYQIIDLQTGHRRPLLELPIASFRYGRSGRYIAQWSPNGDSVAVTETMLLPAKDAPQAQRCLVAVATPTNSEAICAVTPTPQLKGLVNGMEWLPDGRIRTQYREFRSSVLEEQTLLRDGMKWRSAAGSNPYPVRLTVRESLNQTPKLVAIDNKDGKDREIFDPNPQLADYDLGDVSVFEWQDVNGRTNSGGLVLPPGFVTGHKYPLVIQTHGFDPNRFFKTGYSETSSAGRALAARDIIVLQVKEPNSGADESWEDATKLGMDVYISAIDQLANRGLIDSTKVGITGYSYTGWTVTTSITRAPNRFAAAAIANSDPVTLTGYFSYVGTPLADAVAQAYVGARPYEQGLQTWVERVPSLSSDKIQAPVLFSAADPWHLIGMWDLYAALRDQRKPVELQYFRTGQHNIIQARQRFEHQQIIVDWFDFWLNGHEDATTEKEKQYTRWKKLRDPKGAAPQLNVP